MAPLDLMECHPQHCTLLARACASRHVLRLPSGGGKGAPRFPFCAACPVGAAVMAELEAAGWERPPDTLPAVTLPLPQRRARFQWVRSFPAHAEPDSARLDPMREAVLAMPDDHGEPADLG